MIHTVHLFAAARELVGSPTLSVELPDGASVAQLRQRLVIASPGLAKLLPNCRIAIDHDFAADDCILTANDEVAVIPPVSGG